MKREAQEAMETGAPFPDTSLTLPLERHQRPEEACRRASPTGQLQVHFSHQLSQLGSRQINEPCDIADHQLSEHLRFLVPKFFHKKVRVEDDGLASKGRVIADNKTADGITEKRETKEPWGDRFYVLLMPSQPHNSSLFLRVNLHIGLLENLILNLFPTQKKTIWTGCCLRYTHLDSQEFSLKKRHQIDSLCYMT